jgi:hypothetical protein
VTSTIAIDGVRVSCRCASEDGSNRFFGGETAMKVIKLRSVDAAIRTLDESERGKVFAWLHHLENWENDEHVRKMSKRTSHDDVYVLNTSDDLRIFFKLDGPNQEISIIDIAKPSRFENVPVASE